MGNPLRSFFGGDGDDDGQDDEVEKSWWETADFNRGTSWTTELEVGPELFGYGYAYPEGTPWTETFEYSTGYRLTGYREPGEQYPTPHPGEEVSVSPESVAFRILGHCELCGRDDGPETMATLSSGELVCWKCARAAGEFDVEDDDGWVTGGHGLTSSDGGGWVPMIMGEFGPITDPEFDPTWLPGELGDDEDQGEWMVVEDLDDDRDEWDRADPNSGSDLDYMTGRGTDEPPPDVEMPRTHVDPESGWYRADLCPGEGCGAPLYGEEELCDDCRRAKDSAELDGMTGVCESCERPIIGRPYRYDDFRLCADCFAVSEEGRVNEPLEGKEGRLTRKDTKRIVEALRGGFGPTNVHCEFCGGQMQEGVWWFQFFGTDGFEPVCNACIDAGMVASQGPAHRGVVECGLCARLVEDWVYDVEFPEGFVCQECADDGYRTPDADYRGGEVESGDELDEGGDVLTDERTLFAGWVDASRETDWAPFADFLGGYPADADVLTDAMYGQVDPELDVDSDGVLEVDREGVWDLLGTVRHRYGVRRCDSCGSRVPDGGEWYADGEEYLCSICGPIYEDRDMIAENEDEEAFGTYDAEHDDDQGELW